MSPGEDIKTSDAGNEALIVVAVRDEHRVKVERRQLVRAEVLRLDLPDAAALLREFRHRNNFGGQGDHIAQRLGIRVKISLHDFMPREQ